MFIGCQTVETSYSMHVEVTRLLPYHVPHPRTKHINAPVCVRNVKKLRPDKYGNENTKFAMYRVPANYPISYLHFHPRETRTSGIAITINFPLYII